MDLQLAYPGWHATVDGEAAELHTVNAAFRGVGVPPGRHTVRLMYPPLEGRAGAGLSVLSLLVLAGVVLRRARGRSRMRRHW